MVQKTTKSKICRSLGCKPYWFMFNNLVNATIDLLYAFASLLGCACTFVYENTHMCVPVNSLTETLCPVLMARNITPVLWQALNTPDRLFLVLFFYIYAIWSFSSYQLTVTQLISNKKEIIFKWYRKQRNLKFVGL